MIPASNIQRTHRGPASVGFTLRIEHERPIGNTVRGGTAGDEHFAVRKQSGGVLLRPRGSGAVGAHVPAPGSNSSALLRTPLVPKPATTKIFPLFNRIARCSRRPMLIGPVGVKLPVAGSYNSALRICKVASLPPAISTLPFSRSVAVWRERGVLSGPFVCQMPVVGL
jgi:hypothetical protein